MVLPGREKGKAYNAAQEDEGRRVDITMFNTGILVVYRGRVSLSWRATIRERDGSPLLLASLVFACLYVALTKLS
jgi:hypothetical protein